MAFRLGKWFGARPAVTQAPRKQPASPWRAVLIVPGVAGSCGHARALAGKPFLVSEAPGLPLAACDATRCTCRYARRDDRREGRRRAADDGVATSLVFVDERRNRRRGRRKDD